MKNQLKKSISNSRYAIRNTSKAFTLIEMLIVVAIIGILASAIMVGLGPAQQKGRDARRMSDLNGAQNALELYFTQNSQYPLSENTPITFSSLETSGGSSNIFSSVGVKNFVTSGPSGDDYCYESSGNGSNYVIGARLEIPPTTDTSHACPSGFSCNGVTPNYCISF